MKKLKKKIVVCVSGGCLASVWATDRNTEVELIDRDNLKEAGKSSSEIDKIIDDTSKGLIEVF
jgi:hypothetical protein